MINKFKSKLVITLLSACAINTAFASTDSQLSKELPPNAAQQQATTPQQALLRLKTGNERFVNGKMLKFDLTKIRDMGAKGQHPLAFVLSCVDSRSAPDITFDQPLGTIFIGRVAGNVVNANMLGSMEFATKYAGAKLIVVLGHTKCGAIQGACSNVGEDNLRSLLRNIEPAVKRAKKANNFKDTCSSAKLIDDIAKQNVIDQVNTLYRESATIRKLVNAHKVMIVGAMHDLASGKVDFFYNFTPKQQV